jgi:nicotinamidase-related amidase
MTLTHTVLLTGSFCFTIYAGSAAAQSSSTASTVSAANSRPSVTLQMPAPPEPVRVTLRPTTTAFVVLDMAESTCRAQPKCMGEMVPLIASLLAQARRVGVYVVYTRPAAPYASDVLPDLAPAPEDPIITAQAQDKFYGTDLDKMLKAKGVTTVMLAGWRINGSVVYTSVGATLRGYTVVVPQDASLAATDYDVAIGRYQLLTQLNSNATNEPLKAKASTLSRTDMIAFQ